MLKSLIFFVVASLTAVSAFAQKFNMCTETLETYFLASEEEAATLCNQNSSPEFISCMKVKGQNSNDHVLDAAPKCSRKKLIIPLEGVTPTYNNFKSCDAQLAIKTRMYQERARQICDWDPTPLMQNCIVDLVQKAGFHSEHAIQYCSFAKSNYKSQILTFVSCVIDESRKGFDVYSSVVRCDELIMKGKAKKPKQRREDRDPVVVIKPEPQVQPAPAQKPAPSNNSSGGRKVPTPVEIKIEESNPEVNDQPTHTGSTSNSTELPL